jgi:hypothetical protein
VLRTRLFSGAGWRSGLRIAMVHAMAAGSRRGVLQADMTAGAALALLIALPAAARQKSSVFRVGAVIAPWTQVSAQPGVSPRSLRLTVARNAPRPLVQVGSGALQPLATDELPLPASGTVVVTLQY